ncbi:hypothetical protein SMICM17S_10142 [Streptomyces microflavus]
MTSMKALHEELPEKILDLERSDPSPDSELTAGWGERGDRSCAAGSPRPVRMDDPQSEGVEADGVQWMLEEPEGSGPRFTTTYRKAYVEVTLDSTYAHDITPLASFAGPVSKTVPGKF